MEDTLEFDQNTARRVEFEDRQYLVMDSEGFYAILKKNPPIDAFGPRAEPSYESVIEALRKYGREMDEMDADRFRKTLKTRSLVEILELMIRAVSNRVKKGHITIYRFDNLEP